MIRKTMLRHFERKERTTMNDGLKRFFEALAEDEGLQVKLSQAQDADEAYSIASEVAPGFTKDDFLRALSELSAQDTTDLSLDDLERAAGGINTISWTDQNDPSLLITATDKYIFTNYRIPSIMEYPGIADLIANTKQ